MQEPERGGRDGGSEEKTGEGRVESQGVLGRGHRERGSEREFPQWWRVHSSKGRRDT